MAPPCPQEELSPPESAGYPSSLFADPRAGSHSFVGPRHRGPLESRFPKAGRADGCQRFLQADWQPFSTTYAALIRRCFWQPPVVLTLTALIACYLRPES